MKNECGRVQTHRVQRCCHSVPSETGTWSGPSIAPKVRVGSKPRVNALIIVLLFLGLATVNCDTRARRASSPTPTDRSGSARTVGLDRTAESQTNPRYPHGTGSSPGGISSLTNDWPIDVPVYPGLKVLYSAKMKGAITIQATADDAHGKVATFYQANAAKNGWTEEATITEKQMVLLSFVRTKRKLSMVFTERDGGATIALTLISG